MTGVEKLSHKNPAWLAVFGAMVAAQYRDHFALHGECPDGRVLAGMVEDASSVADNVEDVVSQEPSLISDNR